MYNYEKYYQFINNTIVEGELEKDTFYKDDKCNTNLIVNKSSLYESLRVFSEQYFSCAFDLYNFLKDDVDLNLADDMCIPLLFSFRHSFELLLKSIVAFNDEKNSTYNLRVLTENSEHSLCKIYDVANINIDSEKQDIVREYFISIDKVDEKSNHFRYPIIKKISENPMDNHINIDYKKMSEISIYIYFVIYSSTYENIYDDLQENLKQYFNSIYIENKGKYLIPGKWKPNSAYIWENPFTFDGKWTIEDFYPVFVGYIRSARFLYKKIIEKSDSDLYIPMCYFYRHALELVIKYFNAKINPTYKGMLENELKIIINNRIHGNHKINKKYFNNIKEIIEKWANDKGWEKKTINKIEKIVDEIAKIDNNSELFRYPINKGLEFHDYSINVIDFAKCIDFVINTIEDCTYYLDDIDDLMHEI